MALKTNNKILNLIRCLTALHDNDVASYDKRDWLKSRTNKIDLVFLSGF